VNRRRIQAASPEFPPRQARKTRARGPATTARPSPLRARSEIRDPCRGRSKTPTTRTRGTRDSQSMRATRARYQTATRVGLTPVAAAATQRATASVASPSRRAASEARTARTARPRARARRARARLRRRTRARRRCASSHRARREIAPAFRFKAPAASRIRRVDASGPSLHLVFEQQSDSVSDRVAR
jgi:hypothetical protein